MSVRVEVDPNKCRSDGGAERARRVGGHRPPYKT